jgi:hypothetical protein
MNVAKRKKRTMDAPLVYQLVSYSPKGSKSGDLHDSPPFDQRELEHGVLAKPVLPSEKDNRYDSSHDSTSNYTSILPRFGDSSPLCKENHTTSPRHGDSHTEPIAFSEIVKHTPIVAFVSLGSAERG